MNVQDAMRLVKLDEARMFYEFMLGEGKDTPHSVLDLSAYLLSEKKNVGVQLPVNLFHTVYKAELAKTNYEIERLQDGEGKSTRNSSG